jgi:hypothetical protein
MRKLSVFLDGRVNAEGIKLEPHPTWRAILETVNFLENCFPMKK